MILATAKVDDVEQFLTTFTTKGAEKRKEYGSRGSRVFRDPSDHTRVWVVFDWDEAGYGNLMSDPEMPAVFQQAGLEGPPEKAELLREHEV